MVGATQTVEAPQSGGTARNPNATQIVEANDADVRCRLATRLTEGVESCLASGDADHDAIDDSADQCPDTTPGVTVDATGCAVPGS